MIDFNCYKKKLEDTVRKVVPYEDTASGRKVGIVTWCNTNGPTNYGQILQCYAMQKLFEEMGFNVKIVQYKQGVQNWPENDFERVCRFQEFINKNINLSKLCYTPKMVEDETRDCCLLVCGSDQIWNPIYFDPVYLLAFGDEEQSRIAVAVSGIFDCSEENQTVFRQMSAHIDRLDYVSLRERVGVEIISKFVNNKCNVMPDPTLLLGRSQWELIAEKGMSWGKDYIFCYFIGEISSYLSAVISVAEEFNIQKVFYISSNIVEDNKNVKGFVPVEGVGPSDFVSLIRGASAVVTDSYHGVCFANIFSVLCYCAERKQGSSDIFGGWQRINNLKEEYNFDIKWISQNSDNIICCAQEAVKDSDDALVSIIVPVYNAALYLKKCIDSILNQTYKNLEIVFVDDGSTDNSIDILEEYRNRDSRIKIIRQSNLFAGVARNRGLKESSGKYVMFLDSDDIFYPDLIFRMVTEISENSADVVICGSEAFDVDSDDLYDLNATTIKYGEFPENTVFSRKDIPDKIFRFAGAWAWDKMFSSDFLTKKRLKFLDTKVAEDAFFVFLALAEAERIKVVRDTLIKYRMHGQSSTNSRSNRWMDPHIMVSKLRGELEKRGIYSEIKNSFDSISAEYLAYFFLDITDSENGKKFIDYFNNETKYLINFDDHDSEYYEDELAYSVLNAFSTNDIKNIPFIVMSQVSKYKGKIIYSLLYSMKMMGQTIVNKHWLLSDKSILEGKKVILYGFGDVGQDYYSQLKCDDSINMVAVLDSGYLKYQNYEVEVFPPEKIESLEYDVILISVVSERVSQDIRKYLNQLGVPNDRIIWIDPLN